MSLVQMDRLPSLSLIMEMDSKPADAGWGIALHFFCEVYRPDWAKGRGGRCMGWVEGNWGSLEQKCWQEGGEMRA